MVGALGGLGRLGRGRYGRRKAPPIPAGYQVLHDENYKTQPGLTVRSGVLAAALAASSGMWTFVPSGSYNWPDLTYEEATQDYGYQGYQSNPLGKDTRDTGYSPIEIDGDDGLTIYARPKPPIMEGVWFVPDAGRPIRVNPPYVNGELSSDFALRIGVGCEVSWWALLGWDIGHFPALWLKDPNSRWEIDIEVFGRRDAEGECVHLTVHFPVPVSAEHPLGKDAIGYRIPASAGYGNLASRKVKWSVRIDQDEKIVFLADDTVVHTLQAPAQATVPLSTVQFAVKMSVSSGINWAIPPESEDPVGETSMSVERMRIRTLPGSNYYYNPGAPLAVTVAWEPGFDADFWPRSTEVGTKLAQFSGADSYSVYSTGRSLRIDAAGGLYLDSPLRPDQIEKVHGYVLATTAGVKTYIPIKPRTVSIESTKTSPRYLYGANAVVGLPDGSSGGAWYSNQGAVLSAGTVADDLPPSRIIASDGNPEGGLETNFVAASAGKHHCILHFRYRNAKKFAALVDVGAGGHRVDCVGVSTLFDGPNETTVTNARCYKVDAHEVLSMVVDVPAAGTTVTLRCGPGSATAGELCELHKVEFLPITGVAPSVDVSAMTWDEAADASIGVPENEHEHPGYTWVIAKTGPKIPITGDFAGPYPYTVDSEETAAALSGMRTHGQIIVTTAEHRPRDFIALAPDGYGSDLIRYTVDGACITDAIVDLRNLRASTKGVLDFGTGLDETRAERVRVLGNADDGYRVSRLVHCVAMDRRVWDTRPIAEGYDGPYSGSSHPHNEPLQWQGGDNSAYQCVLRNGYHSGDTTNVLIKTTGSTLSGTLEDCYLGGGDTHDIHVHNINDPSLIPGDGGWPTLTFLGRNFIKRRPDGESVWSLTVPAAPSLSTRETGCIIGAQNLFYGDTGEPVPAPSRAYPVDNEPDLLRLKTEFDATPGTNFYDLDKLIVGINQPINGSTVPKINIIPDANGGVRAAGVGSYTTSTFEAAEYDHVDLMSTSSLTPGATRVLNHLCGSLVIQKVIVNAPETPRVPWIDDTFPDTPGDIGVTLRAPSTVGGIGTGIWERVGSNGGKITADGALGGRVNGRCLYVNKTPVPSADYTVEADIKLVGVTTSPSSWPRISLNRNANGDAYVLELTNETTLTLIRQSRAGDGSTVEVTLKTWTISVLLRNNSLPMTDPVNQADRIGLSIKVEADRVVLTPSVNRVLLLPYTDTSATRIATTGEVGVQTSIQNYIERVIVGPMLTPAFEPPIPGPPAYSLVYHGVDSVDRTTYPIPNLNFGIEASNRVIAVFISGRGSATRNVKSVTIGGIPATLYENPVASNAGCLAVATVPAGTTGDVIVEFSGAVVRAAFSVYRMTAVNPVPHHILSSTTVNSATLSVNTVNTGILLAHSFYNSSGWRHSGASRLCSATEAAAITAAYASGDMTWTGAAEEFDASVESGSLGSHLLLAATFAPS